MGTPETDELIRLGLMVPPGCRLPKAFRITAEGYPTRGGGATPEELRRHRGGRWNLDGRHAFWDGKDFWAVVAERRRAARRRGPAPAPAAPPVPPAAPPVPPAVEIPAEQVVLREEGDPDDTPGYLLALRASQAEATAAAAAAAAREAADLQAALDAAAAMAAAEEAAEIAAAEEAAAMAALDGDVGDGGDGDAGDGDAGEVVNLADSDDD